MIKIYDEFIIKSDLPVTEKYKAKILRTECKLKNDENNDKEDFYYGIRNDKIVIIQK